MMNPITATRAIINWPFNALGRWAKSFNPYVPEELRHDGIEPVRIEESAIRRQAGAIIGITFVLFMVWAFNAPIDSGVVVNGLVTVKGNRKTVQHPSGGVVQEILVREGDKVQQGDVLVKINPLNIDANLQQAENEFIQALAAHSRLLAERAEHNEIVWDRDLSNFHQNPQVEEAKRLQLSLFLSRQREIRAAKAIFAERNAGLRQQLTEKQNVLALRGNQVSPLVQDAQSVRQLAQGGFVPGSRANEAERAAAEAQVSVATLRADLASIYTNLSNNKLELSKAQTAFIREVDAELSEVQKRKETLRGNVQSLRFDQSLTKLRAPASGTVVALKAHTQGGVISAGQVVMEIVPDNEPLIVEAAVPPHQIDKVRTAMPVDMRFSAFNRITTPVVPGSVLLVGADRLPPMPPQFAEEHYLIQINITPAGQELLRQHQIMPGMPVEVVIKGGERSFVSYMLKPLLDRFARSFKE